MQFAEDKTRARYHIRGYEDGRIRINETHYSSSLIITPEQLITGWQPSVVEEIATTHLEVVLEHKPQVLILGTGAELAFPHPSQLANLYQAGIGVEVMDTAAACRTYNVLVAENRAVMGALII